MSGVAIGGAAIIGAGASIYAGNKADKAAGRASDQQAQAQAAANQSTQDQLAFNKQQYADWQATYGPIQDNLANYYNNLTPEHQTTLGIQNVQEQYQKSLQQVETNLAQRGLDTSGIMASTETQFGIQAARDKAQVASKTPQQVAQQKSQFLGLGLGNQSALQGNISNSFSNISSNLQNQSAIYGQQAAVANQNANAAYGSLGNVVGGAVGAYTQATNFNKYLGTIK